MVTPLVVAPLVLLGVYLGLYAGESWGYSKPILAIAFSTLGFVASIFLLMKLIGALVARTKPRTGAS